MLMSISQRNQMAMAGSASLSSPTCDAPEGTCVQGEGLLGNQDCYSLSQWLITVRPQDLYSS